MTKAHPVNPQRVVWEMSPRLPDNAIVTSDSGSCANWYARDYRVKRGQMASLSGGLASMGAAVPYAIGAKFAHPDRPVVALVGDGAMQMNNMAELITIAKYMDRWPDKRLVTCVFNNEDLNEVTWEQRVMNGNPRFDASQDIPDVRYSQFAELIGLKGIYVDEPEDLASAWDEALSAERPVVLEVKTDPEIAPLPPHISFKEAKKFMFSMTRDDDAGHVIARHGAAGDQRGPAQAGHRLVARRLAPVAERFGDMDPADLLGPGEIGDRAGDAEDAVEAARRKPHRRRGIGEELAPRLVGRRDLVEQLAVGFGIGARPVAVVALGLDCARGGDPARDLGAALRRRRQGEVGGGHARHFDMQVDAVEQRARHARLVIGGAARRPAAGERGVAEMAAAARVHRRDQLDARREGDVGVGAGDADAAGLERLAQRIEHRRAGTPEARRGTERRDGRG